MWQDTVTALTILVGAGSVFFLFVWLLGRDRRNDQVTGQPPPDSGPWTIDRLESELRGGFSRARKIKGDNNNG